MKEKIEWIDVGKGILITIVVLGHISLTKGIDSGMILKPTYEVEKIWSCIMCWIYACHIPGFFIINGILKNRTNFLNKEYHLKDVIFKQKKIIVYYVFFSSLFFFRYVIQVLVGHDQWVDAISFVYNTFALVGMGVLWFLPAFSISQIFFYLFVKRGYIIKITLIILLVFAFISSYFCGINNIADTDLIYVKILGVLSRSIISFSFVLLGYYLDKLCLFKNRFLLLGFISPLAFLNGLVDFNKLCFNNLALFYLFSILGFMLVAFAAKVITNFCSYFKSILTLCGRESLFIMCTHTIMFIIQSCIFFSMKITNMYTLNIFMSFMLAMIIEFHMAKYYHLIFNIKIK